MSNFLDASRFLLPTIKITGYKESTRTGKGKSIALPYLQESLDVKMENCFKTAKTQNDQEQIVGATEKPSGLKVSFVLDDTTYGTPLLAPVLFLNPKSSILPNSVEKQIKKLMQVCYSQDEPGKPNYLTLQSSNMPLLEGASGTFHGVVKNISVKNELVDALGSRVKALVTCEFKFSTQVGKAGKKANKALVTQTALLAAGAGLAAAAAATYGTAAMTGALAKANKMDSIRGDKSGEQVQAPPKDKLT